MPVKLVIDANIGFKALVPEQNSDIAVKLLEDFRKGVHDLLAPDLYPTEVSNILVMAARSKRILESDLPILYGELMSDLPILYTSTSLLPEAFKIASKARVSVYDALYAALAEREGCLLVTADDKLIKALHGHPIASLASL